MRHMHIYNNTHYTTVLVCSICVRDTRAILIGTYTIRS